MVPHLVEGALGVQANALKPGRIAIFNEVINPVKIPLRLNANQVALLGRRADVFEKIIGNERAHFGSIGQIAQEPHVRVTGLAVKEAQLVVLREAEVERAFGVTLRRRASHMAPDVVIEFTIEEDPAAAPLNGTDHGRN